MAEKIPFEKKHLESLVKSKTTEALELNRVVIGLDARVQVLSEKVRGLDEIAFPSQKEKDSHARKFVKELNEAKQEGQTKLTQLRALASRIELYQELLGSLGKRGSKKAAQDGESA